MPKRYLTAAQRRTMLVRRSWTEEEKRVVVRGFWGRAAIAIEPALAGIVFFGLTIGMGIRAWHDPGDMGTICIGGIFALAFLGFVAYAMCLMLAPMRALRSTRQPIFIVDGYLEARPPENGASEDSIGWVAVLTANSEIACEWPAHGDEPLQPALHPAHIEFSEYGGIHKIDGQSTGVLPLDIPALGIGANSPRPPKLGD